MSKVVSSEWYQEMWLSILSYRNNTVVLSTELEGFKSLLDNEHNLAAMIKTNKSLW